MSSLVSKSVVRRPLASTASCWIDQRRHFRARRPSNYEPKRRRRFTRKDWAPNNPQKTVEIGNVEDADDELERDFGLLAADAIRNYRRGAHEGDSIEEQLRSADYFSAEVGSLEHLVGERRAKLPQYSDDFHEKDLSALIEDHERQEIADFETDDMYPMQEEQVDEYEAALNEALRRLRNNDDRTYNEDEDIELRLDPNQKAHGEWGERLITVDRTTKLWRGGRLESYRALVVGGNLNGCGGFGVGKSNDASLAVEAASRLCKKNIFFVDRYQNDGLTRDLAGKQNSCKVQIRSNDSGLYGNPLMREILKYFGITRASCKAFGNRNPFNVVRATFKALMTHESIEEIAMKRGKRLTSVDRARRLQI